ncbi:MAG: hypothetical protein QXG00_01065 [Candidatus Woesearchaeota archaeon]
MYYKDSSRLEFFELKILKEKDYVIIGRTDVSTYIRTTKIGLELIELLKKKNIGYVREKARNKDIDLDDFINNLIRHDFIKSIDGKPLNTHKEIKVIHSFLKPERVQWLFSPFMKFLYFVVITLGLLILFFNKGYFPKSEDYFFISTYALLVPFSFIIRWILVAGHEFSHYVAARSFGIPAAFKISHRLIYIVAITDVTNIYSIEKKKRYRVIAAGIVFDLFLLSFSLLLLYFTDIAILSFSNSLIKFLKFIILIQFFGILWQFLLYLKTDIYYIIEQYFDVFNLHIKTKKFLENFFSQKPIKIHLTSQKEIKLVKSYSLLYCLGIFIFLVITFFYSIPILILLFKNAYLNLVNGLVMNNTRSIYDSIVFFLFYSINQSLLVYAIIKEKKLYLKQSFYYISLLVITGANYFLIFIMVLIFLIVVRRFLIIYSLIFLLGVLTSILFSLLIRELNEKSKFKIIPSLFMFSITLLYGFSIYKLTWAFSELVQINQNSLLLGTVYSIGMCVGYICKYNTVYEYHNK